MALLGGIALPPKRDQARATGARVFFLIQNLKPNAGTQQKIICPIKLTSVNGTFASVSSLS